MLRVKGWVLALLEEKGRFRAYAGVASAVRVGLPAGTWLAVEIYLRKHNLHESGPVSRFYAVSSTEASASANVVD